MPSAAVTFCTYTVWLVKDVPASGLKKALSLKNATRHWFSIRLLLWIKAFHLVQTVDQRSKPVGITKLDTYTNWHLSLYGVYTRDGICLVSHLSL